MRHVSEQQGSPTHCGVEVTLHMGTDELITPGFITQSPNVDLA